ncbi:TIGR03960 family B12-binding radical SAM protein [Chloroflexota bacterium]
MGNELANLDRILYQVKKPARYTGGEWNSIIKDWDKTPVRVALSYPDLYEIGMSNMALPILYELLNRQPDVLAERTFTPWTDMEALMRAEGIPLFSLESRHPLKEFDIIGFSLGYDLTYTNVLNMLDLADIPVLASERDDSHPLVIAGGSCALNPEPMADFIDLFVIGDGEEALTELLDSFRNYKGQDRENLLRKLASIPGIYVPSLYQVEYQADGLVKSVTPTVPEASPIIQRRIVSQLPPPVTSPVVPYLEVIHDRGAVEIQRGCSHGCRFCQAGVIYRPVRERSQPEIMQAVDELIANCGYSEVSLVSLSTGDYSHIVELVASLSRNYPNLALSLPSLYIDSFSVELMDSLPSQKKTGLTFAPEAGSERLRRSINKNITEDELLKTAAAAFERNWTGLKLYFMLGLPGETIDDIQDIINLVNKVRSLGKSTKGRTPQIRVNLSTFVPKPHTPFQWVAQASEEELNAKHELLKQGLRQKGVKFSWNDPETSLLEAALSRGDRRLGKVIYRAWKLGSTFDSWGEHFKNENWLRAFEESGIDPAFYARRQRSLDEVLPWNHIDAGVTADYLKREYQRSLEAKETGDCRTEACNVCGLEHEQEACQQKLTGKVPS